MRAFIFHSMLFLAYQSLEEVELLSVYEYDSLSSTSKSNHPIFDLSILNIFLKDFNCLISDWDSSNFEFIVITEPYTCCYQLSNFLYSILFFQEFQSQMDSSLMINSICSILEPKCLLFLLKFHFNHSTSQERNNSRARTLCHFSKVF